MWKSRPDDNNERTPAQSNSTAITNLASAPAAAPASPALRDTRAAEPPAKLHDAIRAEVGHIGKSVKVKGDELLARAIQHEIDHIDGILFTDRLTSLDTLRKVEPQEEEQTAELVGA